ncbi:4Fe-4S binding protein [Thermoanaerobacterium thermosaccharolyticum]|uniref:4Fe-4S binding protein n=1 Tax=Thermoanaerobacterium thermosaccharolyticum TaxID=1517 RepID=UPI0020A30FA5
MFDYDVCKSCGICVSNCPPKALKMIDKKPTVDLKTCIRCFCCQELCPHKAVSIKKPHIAKLFYR